MHASVRIPSDDFKYSFLGLELRRTVLNPIAGVDVDDVIDLTHSGVVDVSTDHALRSVAARLLRQSLLKLANIVWRRV